MIERKREYLLLSNLYPSYKYPYRGTFVKNCVEGISGHGVEMKYKVVVNEQSNKFIKTLEYLRFVFRAIYFLVLKNDYDFIYVHYLNHTLLPIVLIRRMIKKPIVLNAHGGDIFPTGTFAVFLSKFTHSVIKEARLLVVPSEYFKEVLLKGFRVKDSMIFVSPSGGIDLEKFVMRKDKMVNSQLNIIFVGRIEEDKRWMDFIQTCYELKKLDIPFQGMLIGSGSQSEQLNGAIERFELIERVHHLEGISQEQLSKSLTNSHLFIFPSNRKAESLGLVGLEAMACGVPVIGANSGGIRTYVKNEINGFLFEPGNVNQIVECVNKYLSMSKDEVIRMQQNARKTSLLYDRAKVGEELAVKMKIAINE